MLRCSTVCCILFSVTASAFAQEPEPKPLPRADVVVSVLDFRTDQPIAGAHLRARQWPEELVVEGVTDEVGSFTFTGLVVGKPTRITVQHDEYAARGVTIESFVGGRTRIYLLAARILKGRLQVPEGKARELSLRAAPGTETVLAIEDEEYRLPVREDGSFGPVKVGFGRYVIATEHPQRDENWAWFLDTEELGDSLDLFLPRGPGRIGGRVLDETGTPRAGTPVRLRSSEEGKVNLWRTVATNEEGQYVFEEVPLGGWVVQPLRAMDKNFFDAESLVLHTRSRTASWGLKNVRIEASSTKAQGIDFGYDAQAVNVTGVLREEQVPISGWRVRLEDPRGDLWLSDFTRPDGMFEIPGLPAQTELSVFFEAPHAQIQGGTLRTGTGEREVHWIDVPRGRLTGQVFVEGTKFSPEEGEILVTSIDGESSGESAWGTLSADGTFDIPALREGKYQVAFRSLEFETASTKFTIDTTTAEVDVILWTRTASK